MDYTILIYYISGILIFVAILISLFAQIKVQSTYEKYSKGKSSLNITGGDFAKKLSIEQGLQLNINTCSGKLSDHYNSKDKSLNISAENYNSDSVASLAVVAHEFGHAMQDNEHYAPLKIRQLVIKTSNLISKWLMPLIIISAILSLFVGLAGTIILAVMVGVYAISLLANLVTLPVEINASKRAMVLINQMNVSEDEKSKMKQMLSAAAMTYLAATLLSLVYFLRFLSLFLLTRRD